MNRRKLLAAASTAGAVGLAGCTGLARLTLGDVSPDSEPEPRDPLRCGEDVAGRFDPYYSDGHVHWGAHDGFSMRVNDTAFEYGETVRVTFRNTSVRRRDSPARQAFNLETYTEDGWDDVRVSDNGGGFPLSRSNHNPASGFEWEFTLTEEAIADYETPGRADVCPDLDSGRYRFVFRTGTSTPDETSEPVYEAIAVAFDVDVTS